MLLSKMLDNNNNSGELLLFFMELNSFYWLIIVNCIEMGWIVSSVFYFIIELIGGATGTLENGEL